MKDYFNRLALFMLLSMAYNSAQAQERQSEGSAIESQTVTFESVGAENKSESFEYDAVSIDTLNFHDNKTAKHIRVQYSRDQELQVSYDMLRDSMGNTVATYFFVPRDSNYIASEYNIGRKTGLSCLYEFRTVLSGDDVIFVKNGAHGCNIYNKKDSTGRYDMFTSDIKMGSKIDIQRRSNGEATSDVNDPGFLDFIRITNPYL
ncbi:MAG: hypothetical protein AAF182_03020 [Pseudomonadota bacterium]